MKDLDSFKVIWDTHSYFLLFLSIRKPLLCVQSRGMDHDCFKPIRAILFPIFPAYLHPEPILAMRSQQKISWTFMGRCFLS